MGLSAEFWVTVAVQVMTAAFIIGSWRQQQKHIVDRVERVELHKVEKDIYARDLNELRESDRRLEKDIEAVQVHVGRIRR